MIRIMKLKFLIISKKKYKEINKNCNFNLQIHIFPKISLFYKMETRVESEDYDIIHFKTHITIFEGNFI